MFCVCMRACVWSYSSTVICDNDTIESHKMC